MKLLIKGNCAYVGIFIGSFWLGVIYKCNVISPRCTPHQVLDIFGLNRGWELGTSSILSMYNLSIFDLETSNRCYFSNNSIWYGIGKLDR